MAMQVIENMCWNLLKAKVLFEGQIPINLGRFCPYEHLKLSDFKN